MWVALGIVGVFSSCSGSEGDDAVADCGGDGEGKHLDVGEGRSVIYKTGAMSNRVLPPK